ncbi:MAG: hypothetical protein PUI48_02705 [Oscillospiraceae bacterium]|nr:hypothetical protein [Oscillospiraceae bacterium]MDY6209369.1 hypothetical protein [Oscillospiraceae bacterium]
MEKFVALEKMSKKKRMEYFKKQRKDWGGLSPVTRFPDKKDAYIRAKEKVKASAELRCE